MSKNKSKDGARLTVYDSMAYRLYVYTAIDNTMKLTLEQALKDKANLTNADIDSYNLDGVDFTKGKLNASEFNSCSMVGVKFDGTRCINAKFNHVNLDRAIITNQESMDWRFKTSQLTNIDFGELDIGSCIFDGCDFSGSDLSKANYNICQFENCYLDGAKMNINLAETPNGAYSD